MEKGIIKHIPNIRIVKKDGRKFDVRITTTIENNTETVVKRAVAFNRNRPGMNDLQRPVLNSNTINRLLDRYGKPETV